MNKLKRCTFALLLGCSLQTYSYVMSDKLWRGSIQFPMNTKNIPSVRIYYAGIKRPTAIEPSSKQLSFDIPESQIRNTFYLVISNDIEFITEKNTPQFLKVVNKCPYKLFIMEFQPNSEALKHLGAKIDAEQMGNWNVTQKTLPDDLRIPDNAIIIRYHPDLVKSVEGGNGLALPKIILDANILTQLTNDELQDVSAHILLSSLNTDTIHARQTTDIKANFANKNILSMIYS